MAGRADPYAVLGVARGADQAEIHAAYRKAVRRTHPDAGGTAADFEAVQEAYETLRKARPGRSEPSRPQAARGTSSADPTDTAAAATSGLDALLAESRRLEDEARRLAGLPPRPRDRPASDEGGENGDSVTAILRDASQQVRAAAEDAARELRRRVRRML